MRQQGGATHIHTYTDIHTQERTHTEKKLPLRFADSLYFIEIGAEILVLEFSAGISKSTFLSLVCPVLSKQNMTASTSSEAP